jgi:hypothetical protein
VAEASGKDRGNSLAYWVTHVKTTIDVADDLFERLRAIARRDG